MVKLGDLGISRSIGTGGNAMTACGTPYNMSPEIFAEKPYGKKTDIWSLGCILCELLTLQVGHPCSPPLRCSCLSPVCIPLILT